MKIKHVCNDCINKIKEILSLPIEIKINNSALSILPKVTFFRDLAHCVGAAFNLYFLNRKRTRLAFFNAILELLHQLS